MLTESEVLTHPELSKVGLWINVKYKRHSKPLKAQTPNTSSKTTIEKQMAMRLFLLSTQTTQSIFNHHHSPFQIVYN